MTEANFMNDAASSTATPAGRSISEFAQQVGIARATFYLLDQEHKPLSVKIGKRVIVIEPPSDWLRRMAAAGGVKIKRAQAA